MPNTWYTCYSGIEVTQLIGIIIFSGLKEYLPAI